MAIKSLQIEELFQQYKDDVFRFALSILRNVHLAEDVTSEVFLSLMQTANVVKPKPWLMTAAKNAALNAIAKQRHDTDESELLTQGVTDEYKIEFFAMLDCLDELDRQIVTLHIVNGLKHNETAKVLDMKAGTIRQRYTRALKTIGGNI
jgi:RNA polymerase sigma-70 factor (ECF subfamily)